MRKSYLILFILTLIVLGLSRCESSSADRPDTDNGDETSWLNWHDTVDYVGMDACTACHAKVKHSFVHTGMGQSFDRATPQKAFYEWDGSEVIHDPHSGLSYRPYFRDSVLMVEEFRLDGGDTVHKRIDTVEYIIGSGQHTNSHILNSNGYLYQVPFTYYTQQGRAGLPPGYEDGQNSRFSRKIGLECMSCHNAMPTDFALGSENLFNSVPLGIDCERCHGPGELHVALKWAGKNVDTSEGPDRSIVNPARLSANLQMELCQRCHLQGNAVLHEGKSFFDFRPGMALSDVMDVYLPRYDDSDDSFIMASHVDRFKQSECYIATQGRGNFNCTSCHNPHVSVEETEHLVFNATCGNCHGASTSVICTEDEHARLASDNDCVSCHMPSTGAIDIPHVTVHDHWIRVHPESEVDEDKAGRVFQSLVAINNHKPGRVSKARAYLNQYERFGGETYLLDSAWVFLSRLAPEDYMADYVWYFYLRDQPGSLAAWLDRNGGVDLLDRLNQTSWDNRDAWTAYRIGATYAELGLREKAVVFYERSVELAPHVLEFRNKFGSLALLLGDLQTAHQSFEKMVAADPTMPEAQGNMGYARLLLGDTVRAVQHFTRALNLDPDYEPARLNMVSVLAVQGRYAEARRMLQPLRNRHPDNERIAAMWRELTNAE